MFGAPARTTSSPPERVGRSFTTSAVGPDGLVLHHDGTSWQPTDLGAGLNAITGTSSGDVYAVGDAGEIWRLSYAP